MGSIELRAHIEERLKAQDEAFVAGQSRIPLSSATFGADEILEAIDSLVRREVTIGKKVRRFEEEFARYCGVKSGVFLNSGSSANLLAFFVLTNPDLRKPIRPGQEVIVPTVSWSTTIFPIADAGLVPVLVDVDLDTLNMDPAATEDAVSKKSAALMPVHVLGNPPDFQSLLRVAKTEGLKVIEDACEAHGASINGRKAGTFGDMASFSFYFSHHISTIEGGMLVTDNEIYCELAKTLRAHGYSRDLKNAAAIAKRYSKIDARFLFVNRGFNLRPTEINAAFGIQQLPKLEGFIEGRRELAAYLKKSLASHEGLLKFQKVLPGHRNVYLGFSIIISPKANFTRKAFVDHLEKSGIETRPIIAGNMAEHPAMRKIKHRVHGTLKNARLIMRQGLYFGTHHGIGPRQREYIVETVDSFLRRHG